MLCSISTSRIHRSLFSVSSYSQHFSSAVDAVYLVEDNCHFESDTQTRQNPIFSSPTPIASPNLNKPRGWSSAVRSEIRIPRSSENWVRQKMQECAMAGNLLEALQNLDLLSPTILDCNALLYCYLKSGHISIDQLVRLFLAMKRFGPFPNAWTFNILINGLCTLGYLRDALSVIQEMCRMKFVPSLTVLTRLMKKSLKSGIFDLSHELLELMLKYGYRPTLPDLSSLISGLCSAGRIHEAYSKFLIFLEKGFVLNVYSYNPILSSLCKSGKIYAALAFFCSLRKRGFVLNAYSYTSLILGFSKEGLWDDSYLVLEHMHSEGCVPTVVTHTVLIKFLCKYNYIEDALLIFRMMGSKGCSPDQVTYNIMFHALCCHNRILDACDLLEDMSKKGCHPDQFTYCTLAACMLNAGLVRKSQELLVKVLLGDNPGDVAIWNVYFHSLCHENQVLEAISLLGHKMEEGFVPTILTFNTMLKGFCMEKKLDEALNFLDQCDWGREGPNLISFNTILSAACKEVNSRIIRRVFNRMEIEGVEADVITMTCLVQYFGNAGKLLDCCRLFMHIIKNGYNPTTITVNVLMDILCKKKLIENASRIFINFKGFGTFPDTTSYNILIRAAVRKSCYFSVRCLLANMYRWGLLPDGTTYELLSYGLCRARSISAALSLENWMIENDVRPSITFYNTIMDAMFRTGRLGDVYMLLRKMEIDGVELNEASSKILKRALSKGSRKRFPKAMMILENLIEMGKNPSEVNCRLNV